MKTVAGDSGARRSVGWSACLPPRSPPAAVLARCRVAAGQAPARTERVDRLSPSHEDARRRSELAGSAAAAGNASILRFSSARSAVGPLMRTSCRGSTKGSGSSSPPRHAPAIHTSSRTSRKPAAVERREHVPLLEFTDGSVPAMIVVGTCSRRRSSARSEEHDCALPLGSIGRLRTPVAAIGSPSERTVAVGGCGNRRSSIADLGIRRLERSIPTRRSRGNSGGRCSSARSRDRHQRADSLDLGHLRGRRLRDPSTWRRVRSTRSTARGRSSTRTSHHDHDVTPAWRVIRPGRAARRALSEIDRTQRSRLGSSRTQVESTGSITHGRRPHRRIGSRRSGVPTTCCASSRPLCRAKSPFGGVTETGRAVRARSASLRARRLTALRTRRLAHDKMLRCGGRCLASAPRRYRRERRMWVGRLPSCVPHRMCASTCRRLRAAVRRSSAGTRSAVARLKRLSTSR